MLLLANLIWMSLNLYRNDGFRATMATAQFKMEVLHTNTISAWPYLEGDPSALGLIDKKTSEPVWAKWSLAGSSNMDLEYFYSHGQHIFDVYWTNGKAPVYDVYFRGPGKSVTWWFNRGGASTFTERAFYDTNGDLSRDEIWFRDAWHTVNVQNGVNGIIIDRKWHQLAFDTNGMWAVEPGAGIP